MKFQASIAPALSAALLSILLLSCSKESTPGPTTDPCDGKTIVITATASATDNCSANNGSLTVSATGSTGFTFKLNNGAYQASGSFLNVPSGSNTVFARDAAGCEQSKAVTVSATGAGPLFSAVKSLIAAQCQSCHNSTNMNGGRNWTEDCNIIDGKNRIKIRAVDEGTMPQGGSLTPAQKNIITNWINAGGNFNN